jgi:membrane dipeptidase
MIQLNEEQEARARRLHNECFVFDYFPGGDPLVLSPGEEAAMNEALANGVSAGGALHVIREARNREHAADPGSAERMRTYWRRSGVNAVSITLGGLDERYDAWESLVRDIARWKRHLQVSNYQVLCHSADELEAAWKSDRVGVLFDLQDAAPIGSDLSRLDVLYNFGLRMIQLTYNSRNLLGDGCTERTQSGLSGFGVQAVKRMNELGIVVDVGHTGYQSSLDAIEVSERPISFSHTGCKAIYNHPRSKTDDQMKALAERDGYMGIYATPYFISGDEAPGIEAWLDHLDHAISVLGPQRVGIGTDWGVWTREMPEPLREGTRQAFLKRGFREEHGLKRGMVLGELEAYPDFHHLTRGIVSRGYSDDEARGILGQNFLSFLRRAIG